MKKFTLRTFTQILTACVAIAALFCAIFGMLDYLRELTDLLNASANLPSIIC